MALWGKEHASATNKPKYLPASEDSDYNRADSYATNQGWVMKAGTKATGNGNANADPEILIAIRGLAGTSSTTGLRAPTVTKMRFVVGNTATTDMTAGDGTQRILVEITYDEEVTVNTTGGTPTLVIANNNASGGGYGNHTLSYTATGSTKNQLRFEKTSAGLGNTDVLTIGGSNIVLNSGTIKDTADGSTNASLVLSGLSAVAITVAS
tara:strand:- start:2066 stop:2692 length:627 start_codon:yes stop_codon:yes gene_type:complete